MNEIFLCYRRSDEPGYVGRLADSLELVFGRGSVYRDVDSERAGADWQESLHGAIAHANIVLAIMGQKWQELLENWPEDKDDIVREELNLARNVGTPVIPVRLSTANIDFQRDFGDLEWLKTLQFFELSDSQGRWSVDTRKLAEEIQNATGMSIDDQNSKKPFEITLSTSGANSPSVMSEGGDVNISYSDGRRNEKPSNEND